LLTYSRPVIEEMEAPELERRLVAILAADVEGYSRLMHADEEATMSTLSARRLLIDNLISDHRGRIANTAEFASVIDAAAAWSISVKTIQPLASLAFTARLNPSIVS
jgi:class 3 adenylate cyclase